jgi:hypothetical protein
LRLLTGNVALLCHNVQFSGRILPQERGFAIPRAPARWSFTA